MKPKELYRDIWKYEDPRYPFQVFIGGRGIGKTYSFTKGWIERPEVHVAYMRRTRDELDTVAGSTESEMNPFFTLTKKEGEAFDHVFRKQTDKTYEIVPRNSEALRDEGGEKVRGIAIPLSVIATMRGLDYDPVTDIFLDEFITEKHIRKLKDEGSAILNAYETICRNREFDGRPPVRLWACANAFDIANPLFVTLGLVTDCERMVAKHQADKYYPDRGLAIHLLDPSDEFLEKKRNTAIMRLTKGTAFYDMALGNQFVYNDFSLIGYKNLKGMKPYVTVNGSTIFKSGRSYYYSYALNKTAPAFDCHLEHESMAFNREYNWELEDAYINGRITFESFALKTTLLEIIM